MTTTTTHPSPRSLPPRKLFPFATLTAFLLCSSCATVPLSAQHDSRAFPRGSTRPQSHAATIKPSPSTDRRPPGGRPDPRYRRPANIAELRSVAAEVARASGHKIGWRLELGKDPGPLAMINGNANKCTLYIHPVAARVVPPNTWAFIFGHEFAHLTESLGTHSKTNPANELQADITGARYAMAAGYRIEAFLGWVLTEQDHQSETHGTLRDRVQKISARFGIPRNVVQAQAKRYAQMR